MIFLSLPSSFLLPHLLSYNNTASEVKLIQTACKNSMLVQVAEDLTLTWHYWQWCDLQLTPTLVLNECSTLAYDDYLMPIRAGDRRNSYLTQLWMSAANIAPGMEARSERSNFVPIWGKKCQKKKNAPYLLRCSFNSLLFFVLFLVFPPLNLWPI